MNMNSRGTWKIIGTGALIGLFEMLFFISAGGTSPEPSDHPQWWNWMVDTLPGHAFYLIIAFTCLPAFNVADFMVGFLTGFLEAWGYVVEGQAWITWFYVTASFVQAAIFGIAAGGGAKFVNGLRSRQRAYLTKDR